MRKLSLLLTLILCILICGCEDTHQESTQPQVSVPTVSDTEPTIPQTQPTLQTVTEPSTEPSSEPAPALLNVEPGAFLLHYDDEEIDDYVKYYIFIPENAVENMPMIVFLHGFGETFNPGLLKDYGMINNVYEIYGNEFPFIVLFPNAHYYSWSDWTMPDVLISLIDHVSEEYAINRDKIIITGHSNGARGAWYMASEYSDYFSAVVAISGGAYAEVNCENLLSVSIRAYIGDSSDDGVAGNEILKIKDELESLGGSMEFIEMKGSHADMKTLPFTKELFEWMLSQ